ncbi:hypothetical protein RB599_006393 [Gaeumannomyces hyphopodioides]
MDGLLDWNPALLDDCSGLQIGYYVYIPRPLPPTCQAYYQARDGDRCDNVLAQNSQITREQFFSWNSFLNGNCDGMWAGYFYCIWAGDRAGDRGVLPDPPTAKTKPTGGVPADTTADCIGWYQATGGDDCDLIVAMFGRFSRSDLVKWNPSVKTDCSGVQDDSWYCAEHDDDGRADDDNGRDHHDTHQNDNNNGRNDGGR